MDTPLTAREQRLFDALETMVEVYREGQSNWLDEPRCIVDAIKAMSWIRARHWRGPGRPMKVVLTAEEGGK